MKTYKLLIVLLTFTLGIAFTSCVSDDDFSVPEVVSNIQEPEVTGSQITFKAVKERFEQSGGIITFGADEDIYVVGYVVSNDFTGNFFEELIIQNKTDNSTSTDDPRMGLRVDINRSDLNNLFNFGRKVYLKLAGLTITEDSGVLAIGKLDQNEELGKIEPFELNDILLRSTEVAEITPKVTTLSALTDYDLNTLLQFEQMQFSATALGKTFAAEAADQFDGERLMESCIDGETVILSTSTFSNFKSEVVPGNSGTVTAVYSKNFFGDTNILVINSVSDLEFTSDRCDISAPLQITTTIADVKAMYSGSNVSFAPGSNMVFEGYVVSSDREGNFFRNLYIQDKAENPTAGIQILIDENDIFQSYPIGSRVLVKLDRLYLGETSGDVVSLGFLDFRQDLDDIAEGEVGSFVFNTGETVSIVPTSAKIGVSGPTIDELDENGNIVDDDMDGTANQVPAPEGILLTFEDVQMPSGDIGEAYAFYSGTGSANRAILSCETSNTIILRNSGFADFAHDPFPTGRGSVTAVLSQFRGTPQLYIRDTNDVDLEGQRCDPVFEEDFNDGLAGWEVVNTEGTQSWRAAGFGGVSYARGSAFSSGSIVQMVSWLISPAIDFDAQDNEEMVLEIADAFSNGQPLKAYYSNDYTMGQDPSTATWVEVGAAEIDALEDNTGFYDNNYERTAPIDMSGVTGSAVIAFVYDSANATVSTNIDISSVKIQVP